MARDRKTHVERPADQASDAQENRPGAEAPHPALVNLVILLAQAAIREALYNDIQDEHDEN